MREEFHPALAVPQNDSPDDFDSTATKRLRISLIAEEFIEVMLALGLPEEDIPLVIYAMIFGRLHLDEILDNVMRACASTDLVALAKELADLEVVTVGTMAVLGVDGDRAFSAVHDSNMSKLPLTTRADGKILKGPNYRPADQAIREVIYGG